MLLIEESLIKDKEEDEKGEQGKKSELEVAT